MLDFPVLIRDCLAVTGESAASAAIRAARKAVSRLSRIWAFLDGKPAPWEFFPFGGGGRKCLGMAFALYEMKLVIAELVRTFRLEAVPGYRGETVRRGITLAPSRGMPVVARRL